MNNRLLEMYRRVGLRGVWCCALLLMVGLVVWHACHAGHAVAMPGELLAVDAHGAQHVEYEGFDVYYDSTLHLPACVAYELTSDETDGTAPRYDQWWTDDSVAGTALPADFTHSGYDRGHMIPAGDLKWSPVAMRQSFSMANVCPQHHGLNEGAWNALEVKVREWARREGAVLVFVGPIVGVSDTATIGATRVRVPGHFYKIVACQDSGSQVHAVAFVYPNANAHDDLQRYATSIDEVERLTGLDFFNTLPTGEQDRIESAANLNYWLN